MNHYKAQTLFVTKEITLKSGNVKKEKSFSQIVLFLDLKRLHFFYVFEEEKRSDEQKEKNCSL